MQIEEDFSKKISLILIDVSLSSCVWTVLNLDVIVTGSDLSWLRLQMNSTDNIQSAFLQNSTIGSIQTGPGSNLTLMDSYINGSERLQETAILVERSNVTIINTTFFGNTAYNETIIVKAVLSSNISIENCSFINNTGSGDVIHAENDTIINIHTSKFSSNIIMKDFCTILGIYSNSEVNIVESTFIDSFAPRGSVLLTYNSRILVNTSFFIRNVALLGAAYVIEDSTLVSSFSTYQENIASNKTTHAKYYSSTFICSLNIPCLDQEPIGGVIIGVNSRILIKNDTFIGNLAGSVSSVVDCILSLINSTFIQNKAQSSKGAGVLFGLRTEVLVKDCLLRKNSGSPTACFYLDGGKVTVEQASFENNGITSSRHTQRMLHCKQCELKVNNCTFQDNVARDIIFSKSGKTTISTSKFISNNLAVSVINLFQGEGRIQKCTFSTTNSSVILGLVNTEIQIEECTFDYNIVTEFAIFTVQSYITIFKAELLNNDASAIAHTTNSTLVVADSYISKCDSSYILEITNSSHLELRTSDFLYNNAMLYLSNMSSAAFYNCSVTENKCKSSNREIIKVERGSDLYLDLCYFEQNGIENDCGLFSVEKSVVLFTHSTFSQNKGVLIKGINSEILIKKSHFINNIVRCFDVTTCNVSVSSSRFYSRYCPRYLKFGVFYSAQSSIVLTSSLFNNSCSLSRTDVQYGFGTHAFVGSFEGGEITADHCTFIDTSRPLDPVIKLQAVSFRMSALYFRTSVSKFINSYIYFVRPVWISYGNNTARFYTWNTTFASSATLISSANNTHFLEDAIFNNFIRQETPVDQQETPFASSNFDY